MKRHLATSESIERLRAYRNEASAERSKAPQNSGLTMDETRKAIRSLSQSDYKIPGKLIPKAPS